MADAVGAFKEAFRAFREKPKDFATYSIAAISAEVIVMAVLLAALLATGIVSAGAVSSIFASGSGFSFGAAGIGLIFIVLLAGLLIFAWLVSGINGAYLEALNSICSGRKQTFVGFFSTIPRRATAVLAAAIITGVCAAIPFAALAATGMALGSGLVSIALMLLGAFLGGLVFLLFAFAVPSIVVDNKGGLSAAMHSLSLAGKNIAGLIVFAVLSQLLALPAIIPFLGALYMALFYMPITCTALLIMYKKAK